MIKYIFMVVINYFCGFSLFIIGIKLGAMSSI